MDNKKQIREKIADLFINEGSLSTLEEDIQRIRDENPKYSELYIKEYAYFDCPSDFCVTGVRDKTPTEIERAAKAAKKRREANKRREAKKIEEEKALLERLKAKYDK